MGQKPSIEETIVEIKLKGKEMNRMATKCRKDEKAERLKVKKAIQSGNLQGAKIYAENAIRLGEDYVRYLQLASKMDSLASRLDAANRSHQMAKGVTEAVRGLQAAMSDPNPAEMAKRVERIEGQLEDLDVQHAFLSNSVNINTGVITREEDVNALIAQVAEEHALDVTDAFANAPQQIVVPTAEAQPGLENRIENLGR